MTILNPEAPGVGVNLKLGGPSSGLNTQEGLGYVLNGQVPQVIQLNGNPQTITVSVDLNQETYTLNIMGVQIKDSPFNENISSIDKGRFFTDKLNS